MKRASFLSLSLFTLLALGACGESSVSGIGGGTSTKTTPATGGDTTTTSMPGTGGTGPGGCAEPVAGDPCTVGTSTPCSQPANPCEAGYIWSCTTSGGVWVKELVTCTTGPEETTTTTAACGAGEVLFVSDIAGSPCSAPGTTGCAAGTYLYGTCCEGPTNAFCVPAPSGCSDGLTCACASSICNAECGAGGSQAGVSCSNAVGSVVDCLCGKV